jgi:hypothetical protein
MSYDLHILIVDSGHDTLLVNNGEKNDNIENH